MFLSISKTYSNDEKLNRVSYKIIEKLKFDREFEYVEPFLLSNEKLDDVTNEVKEYNIFNLDNIESYEILGFRHDNIRMFIPGLNKTILLYRDQTITDDFKVLTDKGEFRSDETILHYRGIVEDDYNSLVALSFTKNEIFGFISENGRNLVIGKLSNRDKHIIYDDKQLVTPSNYNCGVTPNMVVNPINKSNVQNVQSTKCVRWYYEVDYDIYVGRGSDITNVNNYIQGAFNQVSTLYYNEGIDITLSTIFVWTTQDPYTGPGTFDFLNQFGNYRTTFNGDMAHLVGYVGNGGIAWLNVLCSNNYYKKAYSDINSTYNVVPTYSWTVNVLAHEQGHNLGSDHTHDCVWNGNNTAIDGCGPTVGYQSQSGTCPTASLPTNGGTIMSYCHLIGSIGVNFNNGFGSQPRNRMLNNVNNASCLTTCGNPCNPPVSPDTILGPKLICTNTTNTVTYVCTSVTGATSYTWMLPTGWVGSSVTNSITITTIGQNGKIYVTANNSCGSSPKDSLFVSVKTIPGTPSIISGIKSGSCQLVNVPYSVTLNQGLTYNWYFSTNKGTVISGQGTNSILANFTNGYNDVTLNVSANNQCGSGSVRSLKIKSAPATPGVISGSINPCARQQGVMYSISQVIGATQYEWITPRGSTIYYGSQVSSTNKLITNSNVVYVNFGSTAGDVKVKAINNCGSSLASKLTTSFSCKTIQPYENGIIALYPNPTRNIITVKFYTEQVGMYNFIVRDYYGKLVSINEDLLYEGITEKVMDMGFLNTGYYTLEVTNKKEYYYEKFIINR